MRFNMYVQATVVLIHLSALTGCGVKPTAEAVPQDGQVIALTNSSGVTGVDLSCVEVNDSDLSAGDESGIVGCTVFLSNDSRFNRAVVIKSIAAYENEKPISYRCTYIKTHAEYHTLCAVPRRLFEQSFEIFAAVSIDDEIIPMKSQVN